MVRAAGSDEVKAVDVSLDAQRYRLLRGHASAAFAAAGVRPPRVIEHRHRAPNER